MLTNAAGVFWLAKPVANQQRRFVASNQCHQGLSIKKFSCTNWPRFSPIRSLLRGIIAVWRNDRNRHAAKQRHHRKPVRQRADHRRFSNRLHAAHPKIGRQNSVTTKVAAAISSKESANILARLSSMSLFITLRIEPDGRIAQKSLLLCQLGSLMLAHAIKQSRQGENDDNARHDG